MLSIYLGNTFSKMPMTKHQSHVHYIVQISYAIAFSSRRPLVGSGSFTPLNLLDTLSTVQVSGVIINAAVQMTAETM
ncbi:hypothetical protein WBP_0636 [Wolbachia endosymbiont of Brugia pahangi]|nr:hypothetical protein WBP_0636 [Wolbachia endosymbiont of Brugia pahangi]